MCFSAKALERELLSAQRVRLNVCPHSFPLPTPSLLCVTVGLWQSGLSTCTNLVPAVSVWGTQTEPFTIPEGSAPRHYKTMSRNRTLLHIAGPQHHTWLPKNRSLQKQHPGHNTLTPATVENQLRREKTPQSKQMYRPLVPHAPDRPCIGV